MGKDKWTYYTRKASQGVAALVLDMTPHETGPLFRALCSSDALRRQLSDEDNMDNMDVTLMEALAECYQATSRWETRRQILSIMADKVRYKTLLKFIPGLTKYRFTEAKRHCLTYGRGAPVLSVRAPRTDVTFSQIEHFIAFIANCTRSAIRRKVHNTDLATKRPLRSQTLSE